MFANVLTKGVMATPYPEQTLLGKNDLKQKFYNTISQRGLV